MNSHVMAITDEEMFNELLFSLNVMTIYEYYA